ncbi:MAG: hypothetical protein H7Y41_06840 [Hyphomonadaceae bacterium]|nr:hypothetical protein [Clostridia bacterium]
MMKIKVIGDGHRFTIPLPNGLIINGLTTRIASYYINKYTELDITREQLDALCGQLKQAKEVLQGRPLVYVKTNDGELVEIWL